MNRVFIDTSFFFSLVNGKDASHAQARSLFERLTYEKTEYLTSNFVLAEAHALILNRIGRNPAAQFIQAMKYRSVTNIIRVTPIDESRAIVADDDGIAEKHLRHHMLNNGLLREGQTDGIADKHTRIESNGSIVAN